MYARIAQMGFFGVCFFIMLGSLAAILLATPWFALTLPFVVLLYGRTMGYFRSEYT